MEKRDLYDNNRKKTGEWIYKDNVIPNNRYIIVVTLFLINDKNELLIEKRSKLKGNKYGFISGHPKMNESSEEGIINEAFEEIGLRIKKPLLINTMKGKNAFYDFYVVNKHVNVDTLNLQKEEVDLVKWVSLDDINDMIDNKIFFEKHIDTLPIIMDYLKRKE